MAEPVRPPVSVEPAEGRRRAEDGAIVLDVRNADEWDAGHVEGSTWIPMAEVQTRRDEIPTDRPIVVVCATGSRSARVTQALTVWGCAEAVNLAGGLVAWEAAGLPIVRDDGSPGTVV